MVRIILAVGITAVVCFGVSAELGLGGRSSTVITVSPGQSFALRGIGWSCDYSGSGKKLSLSCMPTHLGSADPGDPDVSIQKGRVLVFGGSRPKLDSLATPTCCLRIWSFTAKSKTIRVSQPSDIDLAAGNSISVPSLDLECRVLKSDPDHHDPGAVFACFRQSVAGKKPSSADMEATRFHMRVAESGANVWADSVSRDP